MNNQSRKLEKNSWLIVFLIATTHITNIIIHFTDIYVVLVAVSLIFVTLSLFLFNNKFNLNKKAIMIILFFVLFFTVNIFFTAEYTLIAFTEFSKMFIYGGSALLIATNDFDLKCLKKYWFGFAIVFFIIIHLLFPELINKNFNYMNAGFIFNFINIGIALKYLDNRRFIWLLIIFYVLFLAIIFAHRGSILVNLVLIMYILFKTEIIKIRYIIILLPIIMISISYIFNNNLLTTFYETLVSYFSVFNSRSVFLILSDIENNTLNFSGREYFFEASWDLIRKKMYFFPNGFGKFEYVTGLGFPHNIFLDLYLVFGILSILFPLFITVSIRDVSRYAKKDFQHIYAVILIYSMVELIINSTFITEFSFWILIGLSINRFRYFDIKKYRQLPVPQKDKVTFGYKLKYRGS